MQEEFKKGYRKGYEDGLREALNEAVSLINRGYKPQELRLLLKSKMAAMEDQLEARLERRLSEVREEASAPAARKEPEPAGEFTFGSSYIVKETRFEKSLNLFLDLATEYKGLCITRVNPLTISEMAKDRDVAMYWLTTAEKVRETKYGFISPTDLADLASTILAFCSKNKHGIALLQGVEYLISQNNFNSILKMVQRINDQVVLTRAILLLSVNPQSMDPRDYSNLLKEMTQEI